MQDINHCDDQLCKLQHRALFLREVEHLFELPQHLDDIGVLHEEHKHNLLEPSVIVHKEHYDKHKY